MSLYGRMVRNKEIGWAGGYPCVRDGNGIVHALKGALARYGFLCGVETYDYHWTKQPLTCKACKAVIRRECGQTKKR